jgi:Zn ribbon nucleic-acid-binding protein
MSEYDEVKEVFEEIPILDIKPIMEFIWCGFHERRHDKMLCLSLRSEDRSKRINRVRCGFLNENGQCEFMTKEEKIIQEKAAKEAAEEKEENE